MSVKIPNTAFLTFDYGNNKTGTAISNSADFTNIESVSIDKICLAESYFSGDDITYIISVNNNSNIPVFNIKIKENIGNDSSDKSSTPTTDLKYNNSFKYYVNGSPHEISSPKTYSDKTIFEIDALPALSNALLIYSASITDNAPLELKSSIDNSSSLILPALGKTLIANHTLKVRETADLKIIKQIKSFSSNNASYTLRIYNYGNISAENLTVNDKCEHIFSKLKVKLDNKNISDSDYTYNSGKLQIPSYGSKFSISVPEAKFTKDTSSQKNVIIPGTVEMLIEGEF